MMDFKLEWMSAINQVATSTVVEPKMTSLRAPSAVVDTKAHMRRRSSISDPTELQVRALLSREFLSHPGVTTTSSSPKQHSSLWQAFRGLARKRTISQTDRNGQLHEADDDNEVQWFCSQVKGVTGSNVSLDEVLSCIEFNETGELLATGNKCGRIAIYQQESAGKERKYQRSQLYKVYNQFQSHENEFDHMKSQEVSGKICKIRWLRRCNPSHFLLSANDKTVKLWKITERLLRPDGYNLKDESGKSLNGRRITSLRIPVLKPKDLTVESSPRRIFTNAHMYNINSISINSDLETFISVDDLRINLWHLGITGETFTIVDLKPADIEDLTEVITSAEFHPTDCHLFAYATSKGVVRLCDMRSNALCDRQSKTFMEPVGETTIFTEILANISDVKFSPSGRYFATRDYMTVKIWDVQMDSEPVRTHYVHEPMRSRLSKLYETESLFDRFECSWGGNDRFIVTGSYNNYFRMLDREHGSEVLMEVSKDAVNSKQPLKARKVTTGKAKKKKVPTDVDSLDLNKKLLHTTWHPTESVVSMATAGGFYMVHGSD